MAGLVLKGIAKSFGPVEVLRGIDLEVANGEFVVFVGPSGCGKSTLLRVIAGLEEVTSGTILIDGQDVTAERAAERGLAMVFQSYALYPHMSVYRNIAFALENMRLPREEIEARVRRAATMLRLTDYLDRKPGALSGGQRQRVAIGRAVVRDPKIFLFDEPLSNLDAELRVATRKELAGLHAEIGGTMIYVTHDQVEAMTLANRIVVLNKGRIEQVGTPLELYNRPANLFVAGFIGSPRMNLISGRVGPDGHFEMPGGALAQSGPFLPAGLAPGAEITLGIRPEHVLPAGGEAPDAILTVDLVEQLGSESYLYGTLPGGAALTLRSPLEDPARRGESLPVRFERHRLHVFDAAGLALRP
ncbi:MAG: sn-glycerol-3-phosphate ABC transporter ATP-binding protein UgpC [Beijerinckiaceae bacterium]|nr:sn-glycerol-3-phosphate ABC transporter ATP-binding protein UgpC [Beijerinckiaceae bacterium]